MGEYAAFEGNLEIRQFGGARTIAGTFNYGTMGTTSPTVGESVKSRSQVGPFGLPSTRSRPVRLTYLVGHDFGKPIASRQSGSLKNHRR